MKNNKQQNRIWIVWPFKLGWISSKLTDILLDGYYLIALGQRQIYLQAALVIASFLIGVLHAGFFTVFTESLLLVISFGIIGVLSARLGFLLFISFVLGDLIHALVYPIPSSNLVSYIYSSFLVNIIEYYLLFIWSVYLPITVKRLAIAYNSLSQTQS